ncbi:MAG: hypothetical protein DMG63_03730 [Acidobacteria bacterium]|nr:MAG: hypothetical protein DMG63_03730 [Acidobacteriota bacterium]
MSGVVGLKDNGIVSVRSLHSFPDTMQRIERLVDSRGLKIFCIVDHSGEAAAAGLQMPPTKLVMFGSPKAGIPLMLASPSIALDLPLKLLVAQDPGNQTWLSYNSPSFLEKRHSISLELAEALKAIEGIANASSVNQHLPGRGLQQIRASNNLSDFHRSIIDNDGQLICRNIVAPPDQKITEVFSGDVLLRTKIYILEDNLLTLRHAEPPIDTRRTGESKCICATTASARIDGLVVGVIVWSSSNFSNVFARASARVDGAGIAQLAPGFEIKVPALTL